MLIFFTLGTFAKNASFVFLTDSSNSALFISPANFWGMGLGFTEAFLVVFACGTDDFVGAVLFLVGAEGVDA
jgi:hypothetical protein